MNTAPSPAQLVTPEQFLHTLVALGLVPEAVLTAQVESLDPSSKANTRFLAQELMKRGLLTRFQATMICQGKTRGLVLGNYILTDKVGQGGMGMVYKAVHRRMKRVVALKVLPPEVARDAAQVERFQREVVAAARLAHTNIVAAYDADEDQGVHFLALEFVAGQDLSSWVKSKGALPVVDAVQCVLQAARGLAYAHQAGVIHRDIKPSNLLRTSGPDGQLLVKVLDMGLARMQGPGAAAAKDLTDTGSIMGTCDYIAPEQAVNTKRADHRADIYSLGCTLYYLLTAQPMFRGETAMEIYLAHQSEPIPPLSATRADVPRPLEVIYERMVAKRVEARYQAMTDVVADLEKLSLTSIAAGLPAGVTFHKRAAVPAGLEATSVGGLNSGLEKTNLDGSAPSTPPSALEATSVGGTGHSGTEINLASATRHLKQHAHWALERLGPHRQRVLIGAGLALLFLVVIGVAFRGSSEMPPEQPVPTSTVVAKPVATGKPVKVFIMVGQSNMGGRAHVRTLDRLADEPATRPLLDMIKQPGGQWKVRDDVWVYYQTGQQLRRGNLTVGFGEQDDEFGPELLFGNVMGDYLDEQVLLIKITQGAMSLAGECRPPSSAGGPGPFYRQITTSVPGLLNQLKREFPDYRGQGFELAGFIWFQGWNDMINNDARAEYAENLTNLIKDLRKDLKAPGLPFVIGEMGIDGDQPPARIQEIRFAEAAVAARPEFKGNVALVTTAEYWDKEAADILHNSFIKRKWVDQESMHKFERLGSREGFLYLGSGKTFAQIGNAFGQSMKKLLGAK